MLNKIILIGRLGHDPSSKEVNGQTVVNFSLATSFKVKDREETEWFKVSLWGNVAEVAKKYLHKGDITYIEGRIQTRSYEDKEGVKKQSIEVIGSTLKLLPNGKREAVDDPPPPEPNLTQDDIPF